MSLQGFIDLHCHTTASDGSLTPSELVREAASLGLDAIAITDHDTIDGIPEGLEAAREMNIQIVPGVEISAQVGPWTPHLLGYFIDYRSTVLRDSLAWMVDARENRNPRLLARLNELGIPVTMKQVRHQAGSDLIGRPHFARALVEIGAVTTVQEAFDSYLGSNGKAHIPKARMDAERAIRTIRESGGVAVLAHPVTLTRVGAELESVLAQLMDYGLQGLEVFYSEHTSDETNIYEALADKLGLVKTGGSDYHGAAKPDIKIGTGLGKLRVESTILSRLEAASRK